MSQICCNKCGKEIKVMNEIPREDYILVHKKWGYFSEKDGKTQKFILCEACVEKLEKEFILPSTWSDTTEML